MLCVGVRVTLHGLACRSEPNGASGVVVALPSGDGADHCYGVKLDGMDEQVRVKESYLSVVVAYLGIVN